MARKKILWLCSWYPSKHEPFNGDFIQRHAKAAAIYNNIHVIHITNDFIRPKEEIFQEINKGENFTEQILYFRKKKSLFGRYANQLRWLALFKQTIRNYIIENGKPDLIHVHIPMKAGILGLWMKKTYKIPFLLTEHWGIYNPVIENGYLSKSYFFKQFTKRVFRNASCFLTVSQYLADGVNNYVCEKESTVIRNTVNTELFFYKKAENNRFRFIHVSNMESLKNPEGILRSFRIFADKNQNAELIMIGDANEGLKKYAEALSIPPDRISFLGEVSYEEVSIEMQKADCLILFSNIENSPCVIGEALCCGLPVITTNVGGIPELVNDSNSLLLESKDENSLTEAMHEMVTFVHNFDRKKIAELAQSKFSYSVIGKQIDNVYQEVLSTL